LAAREVPFIRNSRQAPGQAAHHRLLQLASGRSWIHANARAACPHMQVHMQMRASGSLRGGALAHPAGGCLCV